MTWQNTVICKCRTSLDVFNIQFRKYPWSYDLHCIPQPWEGISQGGVLNPVDVSTLLQKPVCIGCLQCLVLPGNSSTNDLPLQFKSERNKKNTPKISVDLFSHFEKFSWPANTFSNSFDMQRELNENYISNFSQHCSCLMCWWPSTNKC